MTKPSALHNIRLEIPTQVNTEEGGSLTPLEQLVDFLANVKPTARLRQKMRERSDFCIPAPEPLSVDSGNS